MKNTNEIKPLTITDGLDIFQAHALIDTLGGYKGTEAAIYAIEDWAAANAVAFAIKYANEGNADDAAALLEIYDGDGENDDDWVDVIAAIDRARTAEWASRSWLEIKTRTVPVTSREELREIERAAAISGLTVTDYGVDDDDNPTDATIMGTADDIKVLDQLAAHFNRPANEEPETITRTALSGHEYTAANIDLAEAVAERNGCPVSLTADDDARELRATGTSAAIEDFFAFCRGAAANDDADDAEDFGGSRYLAQIIADWRGRPENAELDNLLEQNAIDTNNAPENLYRAGVFAGLVTALRTQISWASDDHNEIEAAIYKAYGVAW